MLGILPLIMAVVLRTLPADVMPYRHPTVQEIQACVRCTHNSGLWTTNMDLGTFTYQVGCVEPAVLTEQRTALSILVHVTDTAYECLLGYQNLALFLHDNQRPLVKLLPKLAEDFVIRDIATLKWLSKGEMSPTEKEEIHPSLISSAGEGRDWTIDLADLVAGAGAGAESSYEVTNEVAAKQPEKPVEQDEELLQ